MDRRNFLSIFLATPFLPRLLSSSPPSSTLYILSETPHLFLPSLLQLLPFPSLSRPSFAFFNPHPLVLPLGRALSLHGWSFRRDPASADILLSALSLLKPSPPSFTLIQDGRIRDIRTSGFLSLWKEMQVAGPSSLLTVVSISLKAPDSADPSVAIFHHGREVTRLPLSKNTTRSFESAEGAVTVRVESGRAWVSATSCARQVCQHSPPVARPGERIICAPNRLLISVVAPHGIDTSIG